MSERYLMFAFSKIMTFLSRPAQNTRTILGLFECALEAPDSALFSTNDARVTSRTILWLQTTVSAAEGSALFSRNDAGVTSRTISGRNKAVLKPPKQCFSKKRQNFHGNKKKDCQGKCLTADFLSGIMSRLLLDRGKIGGVIGGRHDENQYAS